MSSSANQGLMNLLQNGNHIIVSSTNQNNLIATSNGKSSNGKSSTLHGGMVVSTGIHGISSLGGPLILVTHTKDMPGTRAKGASQPVLSTGVQGLFRVPGSDHAPGKSAVTTMSSQNGQFVPPPGCIGILLPNGTIHNSTLTFMPSQTAPQTQNANSGIRMILTDSTNVGKSTNNLFHAQDLPTFSNYLSKTTTSTTESETSEKPSMLHTLLTEPLLVRRSSSIADPVSPDTVDSHSELSSPVGQPSSLFDSNTQQTLICKSENLNLGCSDGQEEDGVNELKWDMIDSDEPSKALKSHRHSDAPSSILEQETVEKLFDAGSAVSTSEFVFTKFGQDIPGLFTFGENSNKKADVCTPTNMLGTVTSVAPVIVPSEMEEEIIEVPPKTHSRSQSSKHRGKEPSLNQQFPVRASGYELQILEQPEEQHRARYLTEGSRGAVKNRAGDGHAVVQLCGRNVESATLQVFVGNDTGRVKPHGFYQACKVSGKNSTPCKEREIDGTTVIEMELSTVNDMKASIDNVGILKLRNADVEQRIGIAKAKKKSTKARMIFRVSFQKPDGNIQTLQIASSSILCTQPIGQPEMCKISLDSCSVEGGQELFIIGKNFLKGTKVLFQELDPEDDKTVVWQTETDIDKDFFQPTHLICTVPAYRDQDTQQNKKVQFVTVSGGKTSDPLGFTYTPAKKQIKKEVPMETDQSEKRSVTINVSPEALELNSQIQQQQQNASNQGMFQLPPGTLQISQDRGQEVTSSDMKMQVDSTTPPQSFGGTENYQDVGLRQAAKRPLDDMQHDVEASRTMLEELTNADKHTNRMEQDSSPDILDSIIQEAKQDHPEHNLDKMAEAILRDGWNTPDHSQSQFKETTSPLQYQTQIDNTAHSRTQAQSETQLFNEAATPQNGSIQTNEQPMYQAGNLQDNTAQPSPAVYHTPSPAVQNSAMQRSPSGTQIYHAPDPGNHGNLPSPHSQQVYHSPSSVVSGSNLDTMSGNQQIFNSAGSDVQSNTLQHGGLDQGIYQQAVSQGSGMTQGSGMVQSNAMNPPAQQVQSFQENNQYQEGNVGMSGLYTEGTQTPLPHYGSNTEPYQESTNQSYQGNQTQQFHQGSSGILPQYQESAPSTAPIQEYQTQQLHSQNPPQQFQHQQNLLPTLQNHVPTTIMSPDLHIPETPQNMSYSMDSKVDVSDQKQAAFHIGDNGQSMTFTNSGGIADCHPPSVQFHISDNPSSSSYQAPVQTGTTTSQALQFDSDGKMYQQGSPLQQNTQVQFSQSQSSPMPFLDSVTPRPHPRFEAAPEAQQLAAQFMQNSSQAAHSSGISQHTSFVQSPVVQSQPSQSVSYNSSGQTTCSTLETLLNELNTRSLNLTSAPENNNAPTSLQQTSGTPNQSVTPQIIICNPPNGQSTSQTSHASTTNPSMPSIVILPGGGNSGLQGNTTAQVENILRSIIGSLNQQQNS